MTEHQPGQLELFLDRGLVDANRHHHERSPLVRYEITVLRNGDVINDVCPFQNSFAEVYRGFLAIKEEVDRQIAERRRCPYNPKYGDGGASLGPGA